MEEITVKTTILWAIGGIGIAELFRADADVASQLLEIPFGRGRHERLLGGRIHPLIGGVDSRKAKRETPPRSAPRRDGRVEVSGAFLSVAPQEPPGEASI